MPRRKAAVKREVLPDPLYGSDEVAKFVNVIMRAGKKSIAEKIVYQALDLLTDRLKDKDNKDKDKESDEGGGDEGGRSGIITKAKQRIGKVDALELLHKALTNVAPVVEVKSRRVGGATYQVPIEVAAVRGIALAMRWLVQAAKGRAEKTMTLRLAAELHDAYLGKGISMKMREDVHRMAKANQAFAHYRW